MRVIVIYLFLILSALISGCTTFTQKELGVSETRGSKELLRFPDIPVPAGFTLIPEGSYSFKSGMIRMALLKYEGKSDISRLAAFYKEQMPK